MEYQLDLQTERSSKLHLQLNREKDSTHQLEKQVKLLRDQLGKEESRNGATIAELKKEITIWKHKSEKGMDTAASGSYDRIYEHNRPEKYINHWPVEQR